MQPFTLPYQKHILKTSVLCVLSLLLHSSWLSQRPRSRVCKERSLHRQHECSSPGDVSKCNISSPSQTSWIRKSKGRTGEVSCGGLWCSLDVEKLWSRAEAFIGQERPRRTHKLAQGSHTMLVTEPGLKLVRSEDGIKHRWVSLHQETEQTNGQKINELSLEKRNSKRLFIRDY